MSKNHNKNNNMSEEAKLKSKEAAERYRKQGNEQSNYNYEFASSTPEHEAMRKNNHSTEFGTSYAKKAYNALGDEAKQGTNAVKNNYKNEFGSSNSDAEARSKEAAKQMKNYKPKNK